MIAWLTVCSVAMTAGASVRVQHRLQRANGLEAADVERVIETKQADFETCYKKEIQRGSAADGWFVVTFHVDGSGGVGLARVDRSALHQSRVERCFLHRLKALRFPAPVSGTATVTSRFLLTHTIRSRSRPPELDRFGRRLDLVPRTNSEHHPVIEIEGGELSLEHIQEVATREVTLISDCYAEEKPVVPAGQSPLQTALARRPRTSLIPAPAVVIRLAMTVGADGTVNESVAAGGTTDKKVHRCMERAASKWTFAATVGGPVVIQYPFTCAFDVQQKKPRCIPQWPPRLVRKFPPDRRPVTQLAGDAESVIQRAVLRYDTRRAADYVLCGSERGRSEFVETWYDRTGHNKNASGYPESTPGVERDCNAAATLPELAPRAIGGRDALRFRNGARMQTPEVDWGQRLSLLLVAQPAGTQGEPYGRLFDIGGNAFIAGPDPKTGRYRVATRRSFSTPSHSYEFEADTSSRPFVLAWSFDHGHQRVFVNGNPVLEVTRRGALDLKHPISIGAYPTSRDRRWAFDGYIGEVMVFAPPLTRDELKLVSAALASEWGITH